MPSARAIKQRIKSAKNISKITKAMEMVSASKMRRAQDQANSSKPYALALQNILHKISSHADPSLHPLLQKKETGKTLILMVSTNRGLVGGLNSNMFRTILHSDFLKDDVAFVTIGKKAKNFARLIGREVYADFSGLPDKVHYTDALPISKLIIDGFLNGEFKEVHIIHMQLINTLSQKPLVEQLLPISPKEILGDLAKIESEKQYEFEPNAQEILNWLLPYYLENTVYFDLLEGKASEHSARMISMKNASDNAKEIVADLTLEYNRSRQASITQELQEITTAQLSL